MDLIGIIGEKAAEFGSFLEGDEGIAILTIDQKLNITYANPSFAAFGENAGGPVGKSLGQVLELNDGESWEAAVEDLESRASRVARLPGADIGFRVDISPMAEGYLLLGRRLGPCGEDAVESMSRMSDEITCMSRDLHTAALKLEENERKLENILESIHTGVILVDAKHLKVLYANPAALEMLGLPKEEVMDRPCVESVCLGEDGSCIDGGVARKIKNTETMLTRKDGTQLPVLKTVTFLSMETGRVLVECLTDISDVKRAEDEKLKSQALQAAIETAGAVCHKLNQPLQAVLSYAEAALMDFEDGQAIRGDDVQQIVNNADKMAEITKQLAQITRYRTEKYSSGTQILDLSSSTRKDQE